MMKPVFRVNADLACNPCEGKPVIDWPKALWNGGMAAGALILPFRYTTTGAAVTALVLLYVTLLLGHSAGMHRMMIHRSFHCKKWLERTLIYIGVIVGMGGPSAILRIHDTRDWAQRQPACHDFFAHRRRFLADLCWNLFYRFDFRHPPRFTVEPQIAQDAFYRFLDKTWRWHQIVIALPLLIWGGMPFLVWGLFVRVFLGVAGHWTITYFCHNPGPGRWHVMNAAVQASNLPGLGWLTFGECWHNNHHAFPESARIGLEPGQSDPAWMVIHFFERQGWAYNVGLPRAQEERGDLLTHETA